MRTSVASRPAACSPRTSSRPWSGPTAMPREASGRPTAATRVAGTTAVGQGQGVGLLGGVGALGRRRPAGRRCRPRRAAPAGVDGGGEGLAPLGVDCRADRVAQDARPSGGPGEGVGAQDVHRGAGHRRHVVAVAHLRAASRRCRRGSCAAARQVGDQAGAGSTAAQT